MRRLAMSCVCSVWVRKSRKRRKRNLVRLNGKEVKNLRHRREQPSDEVVWLPLESWKPMLSSFTT